MEEFDLRFLDKLAKTREALNFIFAHMQGGKIVVNDDNAERYEDAYKVMEELYVMFDRQDGREIPFTHDERTEMKRELQKARRLKEEESNK
jgi:hypothetical protein